MTTESAADGGLRELLHLRGRGAWRFLVLLQATLALYTFHNFGSIRLIPGLVSLILIAVAGAIVVLIEQEPLPWRATLFVLAAVLVATVLSRSFPREGATVTPATIFAASYVLAILVLCGRFWVAWGGVAAVALVVWVTGLIGTDSPFRPTDVPMMTVAVVSVAVAILGPTQRSLRVLRTEATMRAAAEATMAAENAERDRQLAELDKVARPMLERIAGGGDLASAERLECRLLEAELRDRLRAPQLATEKIGRAARVARARGVEVVLLDDGGFGGVPRTVREQVFELAAAELTAATGGTVTIRVLPPGRRLLATVLVDGDQVDRRTDIDREGQTTVSA
ncbi:hypothetical protein [Nocardia higoensis]|uniref:hypothetical protein n=1 Tax=Nocardia higoensis TaxID=228599 RepID=UPI0003122F72|nr:hypothetical protein [Nocardia higoensis]